MSLSQKQEEGLKYVLSSKAKYIIGVDEVGTGAWAGPIVVAGAVFLKGWGHPDVKDSKVLTAKSRELALHQAILPAVVWHMVLDSSVSAIDEKGVNYVLDTLTLEIMIACSSFYPDSVIVLDGERELALPNSDVLAFPKADSLVPAVSAASIIAKVTRDKTMIELAKTYPGYDLHNNVGYGTPKHQIGLDKLGPCAIHRRSYRPVAKAAEIFEERVRLGKAMCEEASKIRIAQVDSGHGEQS